MGEILGVSITLGGLGHLKASRWASQRPCGGIFRKTMKKPHVRKPEEHEIFPPIKSGGADWKDIMLYLCLITGYGHKSFHGKLTEEHALEKKQCLMHPIALAPTAKCSRSWEHNVKIFRNS